MTQLINSSNNFALPDSDVLSIGLSAIIDPFKVQLSPINDTSAYIGINAVKMDFNPGVASLNSSSQDFSLTLTLTNIIPRQYRPTILAQGPIFQVGQLIGGVWREYTDFTCSINSSGDIIVQNIGRLVISTFLPQEENIFYLPNITILVSRRIL